MLDITGRREGVEPTLHHPCTDTREARSTVEEGDHEGPTTPTDALSTVADDPEPTPTGSDARSSRR
jgi:hypothetical protein